MKNNKSKIFIALAIVFAVGLIILAYSKNHTTDALRIDKTTEKFADDVLPVPSGKFKIEKEIIDINSSINSVNWKSYKDKKFGYSLKYPDSWYVYERELSPNEIAAGTLSEVYFSTTKTFESPNNRSSGGASTPWAKVNLYVMKKGGDQSLEEWLEKLSLNRQLELKYFQIGDNKIIGVVPFEENTRKKAYMELSDGNVILFSFSIEVEDEGFSKIFYSMIKSFKF